MRIFYGWAWHWFPVSPDMLTISAVVDQHDIPAMVSCFVECIHLLLLKKIVRCSGI